MAEQRRLAQHVHDCIDQCLEAAKAADAWGAEVCRDRAEACRAVA